MAGSEVLSNILDDDEFITVSKPVVTKIETHFKSQSKEIEDLKADVDRLRVNTEQQYFEVEKQLVDSNNQLLIESEKAAKLSGEFAELEEKYETVSKKLRELENAEEETLSTQLRLRRSNEHLEEEKRDLAALLEKKNKETDWLNEESKGLVEKLSAANTVKCETLAQLEDLHNQDVMTKYREKRLEQENQMLQEQLDYIKSELDKKSQDFINAKKDQASSVLELQGNLEEKLLSVTTLQELTDSLRREKDAQAKRITDLIEKQTEITNSYAQCEEQFRLELQSQKKLVALYKESSEEAETKSEELSRASEELRRIVVEASQNYDQLEMKLKQTEKKYVDDQREKDVRIRNLEQELETANTLMRSAKCNELTEERVEELFPAAAFTSKLLRSGMTLTQIYSEYAQNYDALQTEKEESSRLNRYITEIIEEIEEKAPLLLQQRKDYETSLQSISGFTKQLNHAMMECEKTRSEADGSTRKAAHFQRESQKVKQQNVDLSQQVRYLLKEVEELRGGRVVHEDVSSSDAPSSSQLITERLINFRNLEELQEQNQKLLEVVRDLSEKLEKEEKEVTDSRITELKEQLSTAQEEMVEFRSARTRQMVMMESIVSQRDMYKVLLAQSGAPSPLIPITRGFPNGTPTNLKSPALVDKSQLEETKTALTKLKSEYETYKRENAENDKLISEQLDVQRKEASSLRVQNAKLASQLDYATERYKILQSNAESFKKEINSQREINQKYTASVMKHEMTINSLKQDLMTRQELMVRLEVQCESLKAEGELLKTAEARFLQEKQNLMREQSSQNILMTSLQTIQNNLERAGYEMKTRLGQQVEQLEKECCSLRRKLDTERDQHTAVIRHWESQVRELHGQLDGELTKHQTTREHEADLSRTVLKLQQELSQKEAKFATAQAKAMPGTTDEDRGDSGSVDEVTAQVDLNEQVKDLKSQLNQSEAEIKALRNQVQKANEHTTRYKHIADGIEKGLKEQNEVSKKFQETLEAKLKEVEEQKSVLDRQMQNVDKERQELMNENIRMSEESHKLNGELRKEVSSLQHELEEAIKRRELAIKVEQTSREDCQAQAKLAAEAQDKYERELMLHAADVEALTAARKELEGFTSKLESIRDEKNKASSQLEISKVAWIEQDEKLNDECNKLEQRCSELAQQNSVLHDQMSKLSSQVVSVESALSTPSPAKSTPQSDSDKSTEQLIEVIRFIRREKNIAETKVDVIQSEANRLNQQNIQLERQLKDVTSALSEERERSQVNVQTARQHAELMKKVENHNLLADSNKLLREEKEKYLQQLRELEIKSKSLEEQIAPLQKTNREIHAHHDVMVAEKTALEGEVDRWRNRTKHLIEQCNKADPEEQNRLIQERENLKKQISNLNENMNKLNLERENMKKQISTLNENMNKLNQERENLKKQISTLKENIHKLRAENSRLTSKLQTTQKEVVSGKQEKGTISQELEKLKSALASKTTEADEKTVTITQLKKIGRKYKDQAETATKERDESKTQLNQLKQQQHHQQASNTSSDEAVLVMTEKLQAAEKERDDLKSKVEEREKELVSMKESLEKLQADFNQSNEVSQKLKANLTELEKKQSQSRNFLQTVKTRMTTQKADVDKLTSERNGLNEKLAALQSEKNALERLLHSNQTATDDRVSKLEQELQKLRQSASITPPDVKENMDKLRRENNELQARVKQLQKMIEALQKQAGKQSPIQRASDKSPADRSSITSSESPRTANIRPMATPSVGIRPATPIQPVIGGQAAAKATASIRPMAITPTPGSHTGPTPTATVMPTTVSPPVSHEEEASTSVPTGTVQGRPAQRVAPQVEVHIPEPQPDPPVDTPDIPPVTSVAEPQPSTFTVSSVAVPQPSTFAVSSVAVPQPSTFTVSSVAEPQSSTFSAVSSTNQPPPQTGKRQRESESEETESEPEEKKSRVSLDGGVLPTITVTDEESNTTTPVSVEGTEPQLSQEEIQAPDTTQTEDTPQQSDPEVSEVTEVEVEQSQTEETQPEVEEVVLVTSDEEDEEEDVEEEIEDEIEEEFESGEEHEEGMEEQYEDEEELEEDEGDIIEEVQEEREEDIVVIEGDSNGGGEMETQVETEVPIDAAEPSVGAQPTSGQRPPPPLQPIIAQERLPQSNSRNQLAPFMFGGQAGGFEEGDDCTVPSTPTLFVPRRGDGFAEAISSPRVHQRFVFGSGLDASQSQPELAQLGSQGALGMDDTRMDLSQFDEGNSRPGTSQSAALLAPDSSISTETTQTISLTSVPSTTSIVTDPSEMSVVDTDTGEVTQSASQEDAGQSASESAIEGSGEGIKDEMIEKQSDHHTGDTDTGASLGEVQQEDQSEEVSEVDRTGAASPTEDANRPRIRRIVWDDGSVHSAPSPPNPTPPNPIPTQGPPPGAPLIQPPAGRGRAGRSLHRGNWNTFQRGRSAGGRGFRSSRGRRGAF